MPRILGVDLPPDKQIQISLTYLYGVSRATAHRLLTQTSIDGSKRAKELSDEEVQRLAQLIQSSLKVEGDLRRDITANIKRLMDIGAYRGQRHKRGLPVRGQQTRTNARSRKGPRPRVGGRKRTDAPAAAPGRPAPRGASAT